MTPRDPFDADLASWLESEAHAPIPEGELDRYWLPRPAGSPDRRSWQGSAAVGSPKHLRPPARAG